MGGNAKYRSHTAVIRNANSESGFQAMRDSNGNLIRIPESERVVGRNKRTGANLSNARERMMNAQALKEVRDDAKALGKTFSAVLKSGGVLLKPTQDYGTFDSKFKKLANMVNTIKPGTISDDVINNSWNASSADMKNIEQILGVKIR